MEVNAWLIAEIKKRIIEESCSKIIECLELLSNQEINHQFSDNTLSISQSIVHLNGNVRQWLLGHIIGISYKRERSQEFKTKNTSKDDLLNLINELTQDLELYLDRLSELNLGEKISIQSIEGTVFSACIHVIEHFSYHTGQIAFITKLLTKKDLGFYNNLPGLND